MKNGVLLEIRSLTGGYVKRRVIEDLNFGVGEGETVLLIGPNGSGKTTLLRMIVGILHPERGEIIFDGENITRWSVEERIRGGISFLRQTGNIFPSLSVEENLYLAGMGLDKEKFYQKRDWILEIFPVLKERLKMRAGGLSGGERQALAVSMVFLKEAKLILLDEPTAGLDPGRAKTVLEGIKRAREESETAMIIVEHKYGEVVPWIDRVVGLRGGEIVYQTDTPARIIKEDKPLLEEVFFGKKEREGVD